MSSKLHESLNETAQEILKLRLDNLVDGVHETVEDECKFCILEEADDSLSYFDAIHKLDETVLSDDHKCDVNRIATQAIIDALEQKLAELKPPDIS
jgi:hypothetical protein